MSTVFDTRSKDTIVANIAAGMQGRVSAFLNFALGSVFRAIAEAYAGVCLWLQAEIAKVARLTRASTSDDTDLDVWMADFGLVRLPAVAAAGTVTFGRYSPAPTAPVIPVGTPVRTGDGSQSFVVVSSTANPAYANSLGGYVLAAGLATVSVPVVALTPGIGGNVAIGAVSLIGSALPGIDTVTNEAPFIGGSDGERDDAYRARFVLFINSLSKATQGAIGYAITSLRLGLQYTITETTNFGNSGNPGFYVVVDDGTGSPPSSVLAAATASVEATRAAGVRYALTGPSVLNAAVSLHLTARPGYDLNTVRAAVAARIASYINGLGLGVSLSWSRLIQVAYDASPGVASVTSLTLNGGTSDLVATAGETVKSTGVTTT